MDSARAKFLFVGTGTLLGVIYGLAVYFLRVRDSGAGLATVSFLVLVPAALGFLPLAFEDPKQFGWYGGALFAPWLSTLGLFAVLFAVKAEGLLCVIVLLGPFVLTISFVVWMVHAFKLRRLSRERRGLISVGTLLLPLVVAPVESRLTLHDETIEVAESVDVSAPSRAVWDDLVDVAPIGDGEYEAGAFHALGIPRPVWARTDRHDLGGVRIGQFDNGVRLSETIVGFVPERQLVLDVRVDRDTLRPGALETHALNGGYFGFETVEYRLEPAIDGGYHLTLRCRYVLKTSVNAYGRMWADAILRDFERRLLLVLKHRAESGGSKSPGGAVPLANATKSF